MPYWDWAVNSPIFPEAALNNTPPPFNPSFTVPGFKSPDYNPLFCYRFESKEPFQITLVSTKRFLFGVQQATFRELVSAARLANNKI